MIRDISTVRLNSLLANQLSASIISNDIHYKTHMLLHPINASGINTVSIDPWRKVRSIAVMGITNNSSMMTPHYFRNIEVFYRSYMENVYDKFN